MALPRTHIPPARKLWSIVEMLKARYSMDDEKLAATARVTTRTLRNDRANPDNIPLERLLRYLGIELTGGEIVAAVETAIAAKETDIR